MNPLDTNGEEFAFDCCFDLAGAEQAALRLLGSLPSEPCPQELAERTVRCLCALAREAHTSVLRQTPRPRSYDLKDFWLCLSNNILVTSSS
jgi:hypothetical protein